MIKCVSPTVLINLTVPGSENYILPHGIVTDTTHVIPIQSHLSGE